MAYARLTIQFLLDLDHRTQFKDAACHNGLFLPAIGVITVDPTENIYVTMT